MTRSRARRAFFAGIASVLMLHVGINLALETVRPEWRDPEFGWRFKALKRLAARQPVVVALGSSRTQMGLSPRSLELAHAPVVYNFGQAACGLPHIRLNFQRILDGGVRPQAVLIELMPAALYQPGTGEQIFSAWAPRFSHADFQRIAPMCTNVESLRAEWLTHRVMPWYSLRLFVLSHWLPGFLPWKHRVDFQWRMMDEFGFVRYPHATVPPEDHAKQLAFARNDYEPRLRNFEISPVPNQALRDLLTQARREHIPIALYLMPESPTFRTWYPERTRKLIGDYLHTLQAEFDVPIFDASDWLEETHFADGHHQLRAGAEQFSRRLGRECVQPWLTRTLPDLMRP